MRRARRSALTFGCARNFPLISLSLHYLLTLGTGVRYDCVVCVVVGILYQVHKLEVQGRKVKMSIWVRRCASFLSSERTDAETLFLRLSLVLYIVGHCRPRAFPHYHGIVLPRSAGRHTRYEYSPRYVSPFVAHRDLSILACACAPARAQCISVRCVESRIVRGAPAMARGT
jgi:hypothetical protein